MGVIDNKLLNGSNLRLLLQVETWEDDVVKKLTSTLLEGKDSDGVSPKWDVYGLTNPSFYLNAINEGSFRSDLIVYDWEYPGSQSGNATSAESTLKEILDRTFCLIFIFSKADKKSEIDALIASPSFHVYKERLRYLDKANEENVDQTSTLLQAADAMYSSNFSFKFASMLRTQTIQCADKILSDMGRSSLNDVKNLIVVGVGGKKDFVDFLAERFRTSIAGKKIYALINEIPGAEDGAAVLDQSLAADIWSYRLYFQQENGDDLVRRGDIVKTEKEFLLILSADCDLGRLWSKNLGMINAVSMHELDNANSTLKKWLSVCIGSAKLKSSHGSLLANIEGLSDGPFVLPFVPFDGKLKNFVAIPKDLTSKRIPTPSTWDKLEKKQKKNAPMQYSDWPEARRICTISEPFLTPVILHILNTIGGNGVPDYPDQMKNVLTEILNAFSAIGGSTVPADAIAQGPLLPARSETNSAAASAAAPIPSEPTIPETNSASAAAPLPVQPPATA